MQPIRDYGPIALAAAVVVVLVAVSAGAQRGMAGSGYVPGVTLTQQQQQEVARIRQNGQQQIQSVWANPNLTQQQKEQHVRQIRLNTHERVMDVLTPEQRQQFMRWWETHQGARPGMQGRGPAANMGCVPGVTLTPQQEQAIARIRQSGQQQVHDVRMNPNLSEQQKQQQIAQIRQNTHNQVLEVLGPQQRQQFQQWWQSHQQARMGAGPGMQTRSTSDPSGKTIFQQNCVVCHGATGEKIAGWKSKVKKMSMDQIKHQIRDGGGGMPAFKNKLSTSQIDAVATYAKQLAQK